MRNYEEIINNKKLNVRTKYVGSDIDSDTEAKVIQIRAFYNDPVTRKQYWCKFTSAQGWEHICVSCGGNGTSKKVPSYEVMCAVKDIFWDEEECCVEYHPRKSQYVNNNEGCLHIWKCIDRDFPEPDPLLVGVQGVSSEEGAAAIKAFINTLSPQETKELSEKVGIRVSRQMRRG